MDKKIEKEFKVEKPKTSIGKFWNWIWRSDSFLSWLVALVLAFIIVKFVFFPILSLILGTSLPLVVIESGSMSHPQASFLGNTFSTTSSFNLWWQASSSWYLKRNITLEQAKSWPFRTGMEKGDIIVVYGRGKLEVGDVIIFNANTAHPIIHRVVRIEDNNIYSTKGDHNTGQLTYDNNPEHTDETNITKDAIIGRGVFKIPKLGWLKLIFSGFGN